MSADARRGAVDAVDRILNRGGDAGDVLGAVVGALVERGGCAWAAIVPFRDGEPGTATHAGEERPGDRERVPIVFQGRRVAELAADGCGDRAFLERVALLVSPYCRRP